MEWRQIRSLWDPHAANAHVRDTVLSSCILWSVGEIVLNPVCEVVVHLCVIQHVPQKYGLYGVESTGEIIEHNSHSVPRLLQVRKGSVQKEHNSIIHPDAGLIGKLQPFPMSYQVGKMDKNQPLQGLH